MVSGYPTSTNLPRVDGLSTDPRDLGRRNLVSEEFRMCVEFRDEILFKEGRM